MSDSPSPPEQSSAQGLVAVGRILGAHGLEGEIRVRSTSNVPDRFDEGQTLLLSEDGASADGRTFRIARSRATITKGKEELILLFGGFRNRDQAIRLTGQWLCVPQNEVPAAEQGEYFHYQLLGIQVRTVDGDDLGQLNEILETGSNDVYVVAGPEGEVLVPALSTVVREIDVDAGVMVVDLPEGLR